MTPALRTFFRLHRHRWSASGRLARDAFPPKLAMSTSTTASVASLQRMSAQTLADKMLAERETSTASFAVVDVRDDDYIGGHIRGSIHVPSQQLDAILPTLIRKLNDKKAVIFHCALSQQRGPSAALRYLRERDGLLAALAMEPSPQSVYVLDRGFTGWQGIYGEDERLTEAYSKELWQDY